MAYLLDTNVLSELRRTERATPSVLAWYQRTPDEEMFVSVLTLGELRRGVEMLRRRDPQAGMYLEGWFLGLIQRFANRALIINTPIAETWGRLCLGQTLPHVDGLLAATALHHDLTLVTRHVTDVARSGARVFNPFGAAA